MWGTPTVHAINSVLDTLNNSPKVWMWKENRKIIKSFFKKKADFGCFVKFISLQVRIESNKKEYLEILDSIIEQLITKDLLNLLKKDQNIIRFLNGDFPPQRASLSLAQMYIENKDLKKLIPDTRNYTEFNIRLLQKIKTKISKRTFNRKVGITATAIVLTPTTAHPAVRWLVEKFGQNLTTELIDNILKIIPLAKDKEGNTHIDIVDPSKNTIIYLADIHSSPEFEYEKLNKIKQKTGLKLLGLEGWAGYDVDHKRGRLVLNGEDQLIRQLMKEKIFDIYGLEEDKNQLEFHLLDMIRYYNAINNDLNSLLDNIKNYLFVVDEAVRISSVKRQDRHDEEVFIPYIKSFESTYRKNMINHNLKYPAHKLKNIFRLIWYVMSELVNKVGYKRDLQSYLGAENYLRTTYKGSFENKSIYNKYENQLVMANREKYATEKIISEMRMRNKKVTMMVFGRGHIPGFVNEFKKNKLNYIIV